MKQVKTSKKNKEVNIEALPDKNTLKQAEQNAQNSDNSNEAAIAAELKNRGNDNTKN
ncbi:hypothetical protein [Mucilaginibacter sp.]|uniref:hypothetical protein n=1 Tax=Mucilaginibacter sp. TaxID=1882438 RepID=UPI00260C0DBF|nr:hypothetical protein [Mucilaginibacter sp.]MDB5127661.1 hypothetical protein [Mucilaginibacter sp.]